MNRLWFLLILCFYPICKFLHIHSRIMILMAKVQVLLMKFFQVCRIMTNHAGLKTEVAMYIVASSKFSLTTVCCKFLMVENFDESGLRKF